MYPNPPSMKSPEAGLSAIERPDWSHLEKKVFTEEQMNGFKLVRVEPLMIVTKGASHRYGGELVFPAGDYFYKLAKAWCSNPEFHAQKEQVTTVQEKSPDDTGQPFMENQNQWTVIRVTVKEAIININFVLNDVWKDDMPTSILMAVPPFVYDLEQADRDFLVHNFLGYLFYKSRFC